MNPPTTKHGLPIPELICWLIFAAVTGVSIINHQMWRDEWQAILLCYKSTTLSSLWQNTADEGHPMLWFILLYIGKFIGPATVVPKFIQYFSAISCCWVILFYAPFSRIVRFALVFSYFFLFEYGIITRDYSIGVLLILCLISLWQKRHRYPIAFSVVFFLLSQAIFYTTIMAAVFTVIILVEPYLLNNKFKINTKDLPFIAAGLAGIIVSFISCTRTHGPSPFHVTVASHHLALILDNIYNAFFPIPKLSHHCWNSNLPGSITMRAVFGGVILGVISCFLWADKRALLFWVAYVILHEIFSYIYIIGFMRHSGYLFIAALVAYWLRYLNNSRPLFKPFEKYALGATLALQVLVGFYFIYDNLTAPFSEAKETAQWISTNKLTRLPIYGHVIYCTTAVSGYLDKPIIDVSNKKAYFGVPWSEMHFPFTDSVLRANYNTILSAHDSSLLITDYYSPFLADSLQKGSKHLIPLKSFTNANMVDENFYVYLLIK